MKIGISRRYCELLNKIRNVFRFVLIGIFAFNLTLAHPVNYEDGTHKEECEPNNNTNLKRQILTYGAIQCPSPAHGEPEHECNIETTMMVGMPFINTAATYQDENGIYLTPSDLNVNEIYSSTNSGYYHSFGYYNDLITKPKPVIVNASDGLYPDQIIVEWEIQGCYSGDSNCSSPYPSITESVVKIWRNSYILTTVDISQPHYIDLEVTPGASYEYAVTVTNSFGESPKVTDIGFINPNGVITGNIETPSGLPMANTKVFLTPNSGKSAYFHKSQKSYIYWYDKENLTNQQFIDGLNGEYTIELWFKTESADEQTLFSAVENMDPFPIQVELGLNSNGNVKWKNHGQELISINPYNDNDWHHLAVVKSEEFLTMYIDGLIIKEDQRPTNEVQHNLNYNYVLGKNRPKKYSQNGNNSNITTEYSKYYTGYIDEFRIWDSAQEWDDLLYRMDISLSGSESNLNAYFNFDEGNGSTVFDRTNGSHDGNTCHVDWNNEFAPIYKGALTDNYGNYSIQGIDYDDGTTFTVTPSKTTPIGRSLKLDGYDDYINFGIQEFDLTGHFTVEGWFKSYENSDQMIFSATSLDGLETNQFHVKLKNSGNIEVKYLELTSTSINAHNDGLWHHFAVSFDGENLDGYVDGNGTDFTTLQINNIISENSKIRFGADKVESQNFKGNLDEFRIWNIARESEFCVGLDQPDPDDIENGEGGNITDCSTLSETDCGSNSDCYWDNSVNLIEGSMNQSLTGDEFGLVHYWPMNDAVGNLLTNFKSTLAGTLINGITWSKDIPLNEYFEHWFEPEIRQTTLNSTTSAIDQIDFLDLSVIPVRGYVHFEGTSCFQPDVEILVNGQSLIPPIMTDEDGKFIIDIEPGAVGRQISCKFENTIINSQGQEIMENQEFSPSFIELPMIIQPINGINFTNSTIRNIVGIVAGGECQFSITPDQGEIDVKLNALNGCYDTQTIPNANDGVFSFFSLPPIDYQLTVSHPDPNVEFIGQNLSTKEGDIPWVEFIHFPEMIVEFGELPNHFTIEYSNSSCNEFPVVFNQGEEEIINFTVIEKYGDKSCDVTNFDYTINDYISGFTYDNALIEAEFAENPIYDYMSRIVISPNVINLLDGGNNPYQSNLEILVTDDMGRSATNMFWALVKGLQEIPNNNFLTTTSTRPWAVLRVPPGDGSNTVLSAENSNCNIVRNYLETESGENYIYNNTGGIGMSVGLSASGSIFGVSVEGYFDRIDDISNNYEFRQKEINSNENIVCIQSKETYQTNGNGYNTGKDATVYIGGGQTINIGTANNLKLINNSSNECEIKIDEVITQKNEGVNSTYIHSRFYIENVLIPATDQVIFNDPEINPVLYSDNNTFSQLSLLTDDCNYDLALDEEQYIYKFNSTLTRTQNSGEAAVQFSFYNENNDLLERVVKHVQGGHTTEIDFEFDSFVKTKQIRICTFWNGINVENFDFEFIEEQYIENQWREILEEDDNAIQNAIIDPELFVGSTIINAMDLEESYDGASTVTFDAGATYEFSLNQNSESNNEKIIEYYFNDDESQELGWDNLGMGNTETVSQFENITTNNIASILPLCEKYENSWDDLGNNPIDNEEVCDNIIVNYEPIITSMLNSNTISYFLSDDDPGDGFSFTIKKDNNWGQPVFDLNSGQSMCPWEEGTMKRHLAQLSSEGSFIVDVPPDEPAIITLLLGNTSETNENNFYNLALLTESNPYSAQLWTSSILTSDGLDYYLTAGEMQEVTMQVFRGPEEYIYDDIIVQLAPPCEKDIAFDLGNFQPTNSDRINISVHFQEPCTESNIAVPEDGWIIDGTNTEDFLWVTVDGYDREDENLESLDLQYRQVGSGDWVSAFNVPKPNLTDAGEDFTDINGNGIYDEGEEFTDTNGNGQYDDGEPYLDTNFNGEYDGDEPFVDSDGDNQYDPPGDGYSSGCSNNCTIDENGTEVCDIVCLNNDYILMPFNIDPSIIIDGEYELRTQALCGGGKYPGTSQVVTGIIDRSAPEVLGLPEPINGILGVDDLIKVTFNEDVQCGSISTIDIRLVNSLNSNPIEFDFTCGGNIIIIEPIISNFWIENLNLRAEIHNLEDVYGNTRASDEPIVWEFFVNRNPIEWSGTNVENIVIRIDEEYSTSRQLVNNGGSNRSYQMIGGREAGLMSGDPLELPPWLNISPLEGTLTPGSAQDITLGLQEGLNFGHYQSTVYASGTMGDEPMLVDIRKLCHDPEWTINSANFQYSMNLTATLTTDGEQSIDEYDFVGVFVGDELRGVAQVSHVPAIEDILDVAPYEVFLTIYSNQSTGEDLEFRVWDASECTELADIDEQYSFVANSVIGSLISPTNITATSQITSNITFPQGFTWFSINLTNNAMDLNSVFSGLNLTTDDIIKDQTSFAQYVGGIGWVGTLNEINPKSMYLISLDNANTLELVGYAVDVELDIIYVSTGWNWIGYTPQYSINVNEALESLNSATGDIIKSQDAYAQFIENYGWFGSLSYMEPKEGYMLRSTYAGELLYPYEIRLNVNPEELVQPQLIAENAPAWDVNINQFEHSMTMTAIGQVNGIQLNDELDMLGAFVTVETENGPIEECRGVSQPIFVDALDQYMGFLMVYSNNPGEEIHFKLFDADQDLIWSVYESSEFTPNAMIGELFEPFPLNAEPPIGDVTFDGFLNVQDILKVVNFILDVETLTSMERIVADLNLDDAINVTDIVEMIALILDSPLVKSDEEVTVELRIQGKTVSIYSENNVRGLQFTLPGHSEINSNYDIFTNNVNGGLNSVITNIESNIIQDGELFEIMEDDIEFNNLLVIGKNGEMLDFDIRYIPMSFGLSQNYPNPFNPETTIKFELPEDSEISIQVFDVNGRLVNEILNSTLQAGYHQINWRAEDKSGIPLANGIYFYRMVTPQFSDVKKMLLIK